MTVLLIIPTKHWFWAATRHSSNEEAVALPTCSHFDTGNFAVNVHIYPTQISLCFYSLKHIHGMDNMFYFIQRHHRNTSTGLRRPHCYFTLFCIYLSYNNIGFLWILPGSRIPSNISLCSAATRGKVGYKDGPALPVPLWMDRVQFVSCNAARLGLLDRPYRKGNNWWLTIHKHTGGWSADNVIMKGLSWSTASQDEARNGFVQFTAKTAG